MLPFGRLWYGEPNAVANAIGNAEHRSRSYDVVIRVYDDTGNVVETHEARRRFQGVVNAADETWHVISRPTSAVGIADNFGAFLHFLDCYVSVDFLK